MKHKRAWIIVAAFAVVSISLLIFATSDSEVATTASIKRTEPPKKNPIRSDHAPHQPRTNPSALSNTRPTQETPESDEAIQRVLGQLKSLESERVQFCREIEKDHRIIFEFVVDRPTGDEEERIKRLINETKGITKDENYRMTPWRDLLQKRYLWPSDFSQCIITAQYDTKTQRGRYSMIGVRPGNLLLREGAAPMPADGKINMLASSIPFSFDSSWRFDYLFEIDNE